MEDTTRHTPMTHIPALPLRQLIILHRTKHIDYKSIAHIFSLSSVCTNVLCNIYTVLFIIYSGDVCRRVDVRQDTWPKIQKYTVFVFDTSIWILKGVTCTQKSNGFFGWEKIEKFGFQFGKWNRPLNLVWVPSIRVHSNNYFRYKNCHC